MANFEMQLGMARRTLETRLRQDEAELAQQMEGLARRMQREAQGVREAGRLPGTVLPTAAEIDSLVARIGALREALENIPRLGKREETPE